jgi:hypothetical protein
MWSELGTLFWLQWKLTRSMFRSRRAGARWRALTLLLRIVSFLFTIPTFVLMGTGLLVGLILFSPQAAYEATMLANTLMFFIWLVLPASYNSQLVERFEMSRLFPHPIRFRSIVVGSTLMSMLTMTGLWTVPILLGEILGLAFHQPLALPLILLGALPTFALLVLTGRIMDDFFDLVAGDRRLRALVLTLLSLPFMLCWMGQYLVQYATENFSRLAQFPFLEGLERLGEASGPSEFLEIARVSRLLTWLPPGWATAGMGLAVRGEWGRSLLFLALSTAFVALLLWTHAHVTRQLMQGAALSIGTERVRARNWRVRGHRWRMPGPPALWALFRKDWIYLWRSPMPRRLIFPSLVMAVAMVVPIWSIAQGDAPPALREVLSLIAGAFVITMSNMVVNLGITGNYFGTIDREGFETPAHSALDRRHVILSANLAVGLYAGLQIVVLLSVIAALSGSWAVFPLGLYLGLCLQVGGAPAYNLAAIVGPYRAQLKFSRGRRRGNLWGLLAWLVSAPPVLALIVLPYVFWKPGLALTLPLGAVYSLGLYALTLKPLARLLQRREYAILEAVTAEE